MNPNTLPPSLDTWTIAFLLAAGQGILFAIVLFSHHRQNKTANRLLGCFTLAQALTLVDYVGFWTRYNTYYPWASGVYEYLAFLFGPLFWLYFKAVFGQLKQKDWLHLAAPIGFFLLKLAHWQTWFPTPKSYMTIQAGLMILHLSIYGIQSARFLRRKTVNEELGEAQRKWYKVLVALYGGFVLGWAVYFLLVNTPFFSLLLDYSIALAMTVFIYTAPYLGYKRPEIFRGAALQKFFNADKYANSTLTSNASDSLMRKIEAFMVASKPYLDSTLRLNNFASQLGASPHHVSQVINMKTGKSFPDYINTYRLENAKSLLSKTNGNEVKVTEAMYASGFNNKTSFNRIFKEQTGYTPTAYKALFKQGSAMVEATEF